MASVFTRILDGELPGRVVWRDPDPADLDLAADTVREGLRSLGVAGGAE